MKEKTTGRKSVDNSLLVKANRLSDETQKVVIENQTGSPRYCRGFQHEGEIWYFCTPRLLPRFRLASINYAAVVRR